MRRLLLLFVCAALLAAAQSRLTIEQLKEFVRSSLSLHHDDRKLADYLRKLKLAYKLDDRTIEELQGLGAGPHTVAALRVLRDASASLPDPPAPAPKPVYVPPPAPDSIEQARVLQEAKDYALNYVSRLPDFICTQVTRRFVDPTGLEFWRREDVITERLSYFDKHEDYKVVLFNNQPVELQHEQLGGVTSSGEFGSLLKEIFEPETDTQFDWERWGTLRARRMHVFSYKVSQSRSKYSISAGKDQRIIAGYHGLIYVDRDNSAVMKITLQADDIPSGFPIREVNLSLDYDHVEISGRPFILPLKAVITSRSGAKFLSRNEVEFRMYRKFTAESTITAVDVQTPDALPADVTKEQPAQPAGAPPASKPQP
jgi:hypothetical protein